MDIDWELQRAQEPVLRWTCRCGLINAEHRDQFWGCNGRWIHVSYELADLRRRQAASRG